MSALKLALLILSLFAYNRFSILNIGVGYVGMAENPAFTISEVTFGEFQDYKIIPQTKYVSFGLFVGGVKLFPNLLLDRTDKTFEFVRTLRIIPGGGMLPVSLFIYSPRLVISVTSGDSVYNVVPNIRFQIIPISDLLLMTIINPSLFTKKIYTAGPYPHFEVSSGLKGFVENFDFEMKFGVRTYHIIRPSMSRAEEESIREYERSGVKKIVGTEYNQKYGIFFFADMTLAFNLSSYYVTKIVTREEREIQAALLEPPELKERLAELEKKLAELEKQRQEEIKKLEEMLKRAEEKKAAETPREVVKIRETERELEKQKDKNIKVYVEDLWKEQIVSIDRYEKGGKLYLSWKIPQTENIEELSLERCVGYACVNFSKIASLSLDTTKYVDQIVENQIYCYRLSVSIVKTDVEAKTKEKIRDNIKSSRVCGYVSFKGDLIRVYF